MRKRTRNDAPEAIARAREMRGAMGASESVMWGYLRHERTGFKFRRQYPAGPYFLDFFCREASLAVEVDGECHAERTDRDAMRDAWLASRGIEVLRVPSLALFESTGLEIGRWVERITERCAARSPKPPPPAPPP